MIDGVEIKEQQNIFDALLAAGGTIVDAFSFLIVANDDSSISWINQTGNIIDRGTVDYLDFNVLAIYKKNNHIPVNRAPWDATDPTNFQTAPIGIGGMIVGASFQIG
jgi:hypothetical protein